MREYNRAEISWSFTSRAQVFQFPGADGGGWVPWDFQYQNQVCGGKFCRGRSPISLRVLLEGNPLLLLIMLTWEDNESSFFFCPVLFVDGVVGFFHIYIFFNLIQLSPLFLLCMFDMILLFHLFGLVALSSAWVQGSHLQYQLVMGWKKFIQGKKKIIELSIRLSALTLK